MNKTARVITLFRCDKSCSGCCNVYSKIMSNAIHISQLSELRDYDTICITGGEPLLRPDMVLADIQTIRKDCPNSKLYLYTALYTHRLEEIVNACDGVHFTLHEHATDTHIEGFYRFQEIVQLVHGKGKSFRLYIDPRVTLPVTILPWLWKRVEIKTWLTEEELLKTQPDGLPNGETLFILDRQETSQHEFSKHVAKISRNNFK